MSFHPEQIGVWGSAVEFPVTADGMVAYADATNDPIAVHREGRLAPPVFAIVPAFGALADRALSAVPDELMMRVLHGEHDFRFHRPIVAGDQLICRARVTGIHGKSSGVVVGAYLETRDAEGDLVNEQYFTGFFRGGEFGEAGEPVPQHSFDQSLRQREPDWTAVQKYDEDQTFRYAKASGDPMPIHTDDAFAKSVGLPGIIIHGMCTMAFTSHAVISRVSPAHPENLKRLAVRFSAPAQPKHTITTSAWNTKPGTYAFETVTNEEATIIKDGLAEFAS
jgi:acyl dehydratase